MTQQKTASLLITGATGTIGSELVRILTSENLSFRVVVRREEDRDRFSRFPNVDVWVGNLKDTAFLEPALRGIERAFLLTHSSEEAEMVQKGFVHHAKKAGVQHLVKLSQFAADPESSVRFLRYHARVEDAIRESGMAYTFLRPNLFMQGFLHFRDLIAGKGVFFAAAGKAAVSLVDVRDIAAVAARVLTGNGHEGKVYDLTGPEALTHLELALVLTKVLGRNVQYIDREPEAFGQALKEAGFAPWQAEGLVEDYRHYAKEEAAFVSGSVEAITGNRGRDFRSFAADHASLFQAV